MLRNLNSNYNTSYRYVHIGTQKTDEICRVTYISLVYNYDFIDLCSSENLWVPGTGILFLKYTIEADAVSQYRFYCCKVLSSLSLLKQCFNIDVPRKAYFIIYNIKRKLTALLGLITHWY